VRPAVASPFPTPTAFWQVVENIKAGMTPEQRRKWDEAEQKLDGLGATSSVVASVCTDGWRTSSTGRGTCSHHGGVKWVVIRKNNTEYTCLVNDLRSPRV
jgi:hypothetical protein